MSVEIKLLCACTFGNLCSVKFLAEVIKCHPATVRNIRNGDTPLHVACENGNIEIIKYLISIHKCDPQCANFLCTAKLTHPGDTPLHKACLNDHLDVVRYLVSECNCNPQYPSYDGVTPLHSACQNGHHDIARYLITECSCNPQCPDNNGVTPLHLACKNGHLDIARYLITECNYNPQRVMNNGITPLQSACLGGALDVARYLITQCSCNPESSDSNGRTSLHSACQNGHLDIARYLITECSCNPQCPDNKGVTPLHSACQNGHLDIARYLITECSCNPQCPDNNGVTPLHLACKNDHLGIARYLITECNCNPQCVMNDGITSLQSACLSGALDVARYLITQCSCNPESSDSNGRTPLHSACQNGHLDIARYLITECSCNPQCPDNNGVTPLHLACQHLDLVRYLIAECSCNPQCPDNNGITPLHLAFQHLDLARYLITECNCNPQCAMKDGTTPLHLACLGGALDVTRYLITQCHCNPESSECNGRTPLHNASQNGHLDIARYLITECSCNPQCVSNDGATPLHLTCQAGHLDIVRYLITECSCNPQYSDNDGVTPLHLACKNGHLDIARYLITECSCNPQCVANDGITPLQLACLGGAFDVVRYLITQCSCNPESSDNLGRTLLHSACQNGHLDMVRYLITECSCDLQCVSNEGATPLHITCLNGHLDIARYLITECSCNPQCVSNDGTTPLHLTCQTGHFDIARYLITKCSCNPQCSYADGVTPLHLACNNGHLDIARYLITECSCNPQCVKNDGITPLQSACLGGAFDVARYLITQCSCNPESSDNQGRTSLHHACQNGHLDIARYLITECSCNPQCSDNNGVTPLHLSCYVGHEEIVKYLLSTGSCNPLQMDIFGRRVVDVIKCPKIKETINNYYDCVIRYPIESYIKIFTVGDIRAGKSTLVKSLQQNPGLFSSFIGHVLKQHVSGVSAATAGIETFAFNSKAFGNVVIYDFAGDYEYYTSQAAFLQSFTSQMAGLFLLVINCKQGRDKIIESFHYWTSFIQECWGHTRTKAHVIVVGSHGDKVRNIDDKYTALEELFSSPLCGIKSGGVICLDCRKPSSLEVNHLHSVLDTACSILRKESVEMDRRCYVLYEHLQTNHVNRGLPACTVQSMTNILRLENHPLLPNTSNELLPLLKTLHDKGQIILLENENYENSWIICQKAIILQGIVGRIFAPSVSEEHVHFSSTGIVSHSKVENMFPHLSSDMIVDFMKHFEFCHAIENPSTLIDDCRTGGRCYLFPALIKSERPSIIWDDSKIKQLSYHCGWYIKCLKVAGRPTFFNSRFLHVLLLRLAFKFALPPEPSQSSEQSTGLALEQRCKMWKNGIFWSSRKGTTIHFELTQHSQTAILIMGCQRGCEMKCVRLRSRIIQTILAVKDETSPLVIAKEGMFADPLKLMRYVNQPHFILEAMGTYSLIEISTAISESESAVVGHRPDDNVQLSELLYFEPYVFVSKDTVKALFVEDKQQEVVTEEFLAGVAQHARTGAEFFAVVFKKNPNVQDEERWCLQILRGWKASQGFDATYSNFRQTLDSYSIYCGRNPSEILSSHQVITDSESENTGPYSALRQNRRRPPTTLWWLLNKTVAAIRPHLQWQWLLPAGFAVTLVGIYFILRYKEGRLPSPRAPLRAIASGGEQSTPPGIGPLNPESWRTLQELSEGHIFDEL